MSKEERDQIECWCRCRYAARVLREAVRRGLQDVVGSEWAKEAICCSDDEYDGIISNWRSWSLREEGAQSRGYGPGQAVDEQNWIWWSRSAGSDRGGASSWSISQNRSPQSPQRWDGACISTIFHFLFGEKTVSNISLNKTRAAAFGPTNCQERKKDWHLCNIYDLAGKKQGGNVGSTIPEIPALNKKVG